jgi:hypothetical protein
MRPASIALPKRIVIGKTSFAEVELAAAPDIWAATLHIDGGAGGRNDEETAVAPHCSSSRIGHPGPLPGRS